MFVTYILLTNLLFVIILTADKPYQEEQLISRFRVGEEDAFTQVYDHFYFLIYQYAKRWLENRQDAEDVTAETFIKLFQRRGQFGNLENIAAFLKVTARNACLNNLKHERVKSDKQYDLQRLLSQDNEADFGWAEAQEVFIRLVYSEVERLPLKMKEIFLLAYRDGLKSAEIAERLHLQVRTVTNQKANAVRLLKIALTDRPLLLAMLLLLESQ